MAFLDPQLIVFLQKQIIPLILIMILTFYAVKWRDGLMMVIVALGIVAASLRITGSRELDLGLVSVVFLNSLLVFYKLLEGMEAKHKIKVAQEKLNVLTDAIKEHNGKD